MLTYGIMPIFRSVRRPVYSGLMVQVAPETTNIFPVRANERAHTGGSLAGGAKMVATSRAFYLAPGTRGLVVRFARDFRDWGAVSRVLFGSVVALTVNIVISIVATIQGWLTANAW